MVRRIGLLISGILIVYAVNSYAAEVQNNVWQIGTAGSTDTIKLIDDENTVGEEALVLNINESEKMIKANDVSIESYGGSYFVADKDGNVLDDLTVEAVFKTRYEQILQLLKDEKFRAAFEEIPESCVAEANGFLIITDNVAGASYGYCLIPAPTK